MRKQIILAGALCSGVLGLSTFSPAADSASAGTPGPSASPATTPSNPLAPEFGPSVTFDAADAPIQLSDLRGKMALVVFFQSWCPICNGWSPDMIKQITTTFGNDPAVALVAIKCDGGTPAEAKNYMKEHGADLSKWIVASDDGGLYYQRVAGTNALWGYALIDEGGHVVQHGQAGTYYPDPAGKKFVIADPGLKSKAPNAAALLPADDATPPELKPIAHAAEMGHAVPAIRVLKSYEHGKTKEAAAKMREALTAALSARVEQATTDLKSDDLQLRYDAYHYLRSMSMMSDLAPGKAAKAALTSLKTDKAAMKEFAKQERAESAYWGMMSKAEHIEVAMRKSQLPDAMKQFASAYTGTAYAERATNEAQTIEGGTLAR